MNRSGPPPLSFPGGAPPPSPMNRTGPPAFGMSSLLYIFIYFALFFSPCIEPTHFPLLPFFFNSSNPN
jgi:hypothetical protein